MSKINYKNIHFLSEVEYFFQKFRENKISALNISYNLNKLFRSQAELMQSKDFIKVLEILEIELSSVIDLTNKLLNDVKDIDLRHILRKHYYEYILNELSSYNFFEKIFDLVSNNYVAPVESDLKTLKKAKEKAEYLKRIDSSCRPIGNIAAKKTYKELYEQCFIELDV